MLSLILATFAAATLEQNVRSVMPTPAEEKWLTIPWHTNLMEARLVSQREGKPLFLWIMNGNPLGCT